MLRSFCHIEIPTTNLERARDFYSGLFGWKVELMPEQDYATFETGAPPAGGFRKVDEVDQAGPGSPLNYILVENIEATIDKAQKLGAGQVIVGRTAVGDMGWFAIFTDPDGNCVALWQEKQ
jgi:predicted enzyme related to lactoylglutathione lyase